jgi:hypothetical protein
MPLVAVIAVSVGLVCMYKVHQFSEPEPVITVNGPQAPENFDQKKLTYEVFGGPLGKAAKIVYVVAAYVYRKAERPNSAMLDSRRDHHADRGIRRHLSARPRRSAALPHAGERHAATPGIRRPRGFGQSSGR